ncbi:MAG: glycine/betaine/sarcosine/D-proline family reductase selenoprotein B [Acidimicrobiia bacterium]|nr:glycine/betaine/sarcosine/D-proline family reductase selenoprotein B [Acidimicrobiia bacterium]
MDDERSGRPSTAVDYIAETRATYDALGYPPYRWVASTDDPPLATLTKPLAESRVALIASGGIYRAGQIAFHFKDDASYRVIPTDTPTEELRATHFAYDLRDARRDINVVFPIDTLRGLARDGVIGGMTDRAYTFMGGIYSTRKVREELTPALRDRVIEDGADVVLLVPV